MVTFLGPLKDLRFDASPELTLGTLAWPYIFSRSECALVDVLLGNLSMNEGTRQYLIGLIYY